ncbi:GNAT family N-acetyltransferase [Salicibibacter cibarius]|uniref:GNAT family N-acetyltransferase n=1 Tax=Salicibibacter cibarius TaxID=2743000 RepID=A0A7T7CBR8_9BACI|nr:GNAT family N-acetyltransferase [Salicibibacter cibarius]QQK76259.1 GNAT family N-acetyltransferase [Salicibibacter cibarius]
MNIREAKVSDADKIAPLFELILSPHINHWIGDVEKKQRLEFINHFVREDNNAFSYKYCHVYGDDSSVAGVISHYPGYKDDQLFEPIFDFLKKHYPNLNYDSVEDDVDPDDYYINLISVSSKFRGEGIGNQLIGYAENRAKARGYKTVSLNVEFDNSRAQKLYERLGYHFQRTNTSDGLKYRYLVKEQFQ